MCAVIVMVEAPNSELGLRPWPKDADRLDGGQNCDCCYLVSAVASFDDMCFGVMAVAMMCLFSCSV